MATIDSPDEWFVLPEHVLRQFYGGMENAFRRLSYHCFRNAAFGIVSLILLLPLAPIAFPKRKLGSQSPARSEYDNSIVCVLIRTTIRLLRLCIIWLTIFPKKEYQSYRSIYTQMPRSTGPEGNAMEITEVHLTLVEKPRDRLRAFCSITFDDSFVVKDLKVIEGRSGLFVAMPSRKRTTRCFKCNAKNPLQAAYCSQCGSRFQNTMIECDGEENPKFYSEIVHPITASCRQAIEARVLGAYEGQRRHAGELEEVVSRSPVSEPLRGPHRLSKWRSESNEHISESGTFDLSESR